MADKSPSSAPRLRDARRFDAAEPPPSAAKCEGCRQVALLCQVKTPKGNKNLCPMCCLRQEEK